MNKKGFFPIILVILAFLFIFFFFGSSFKIGSFFSGGNLGNWDVASYDNSGKLIISLGTFTVNSQGSLGAYNVNRRGISVIQNKKDCEMFGFTWRLLDQTPEDGSQCFLQNEKWFEGKTYTSSVSCTHTKCGYINGLDFGQCSHSIIPSFDGIDVAFPEMKRGLDDSASCSGDLTIQMQIGVNQGSGNQPLPIALPEVNKPILELPAIDLGGILSQFWQFVLNFFHKLRGYFQ